MKRARSVFTPALRFDVLTPLYDTVVRYTTRERLFKSMLIDAASIKSRECVLDVGSGTGTLLLEIARRVPAAQLTGIDADSAILEIAARKLNAAGHECQLVLGNSTDMAFADATFDHVVSTLFFHHLMPIDKRTTVEEIWRVLRPGGAANVVDWGRPTGPFQRIAFCQIQLLDGFATTQDHVTDKLNTLFCQAGFEKVKKISYLRTIFGTLRFIHAVKPRA